MQAADDVRLDWGKAGVRAGSNAGRGAAWNAAAHSDIATTDWTITPNRGANPTSGGGFFQAPVVAYSEDHNDSKNDPVLQQQPDLKVQPDYGTPIDDNQDGLTDVLVHNVHGTAFNFGATWSVLLAP